MVRAKFVVQAVKKNDKGEGSVKLTAVCSGSPEDDTFFHYTPWGSIEIGTINAAALAEFEEGKAYYVDFTPAKS